MPVLDEMLVELGFEYDPKELGKFKSDVAKTSKIVGGLAKAAVAAAVAITGMAVASTAATDEQGKLADEIGDTVGNIDALQHALVIAGGTADGMGNSLKQLSIRAAEAARGTGSGVEAFGLLGISSVDANGNLKKTSDLMIEVSRAMQGLSKAEQIELADKLGLSDSIRLLQQGPGAIEDLVKEAKALGVATEEDAKIAAEFQDSLADIWKIVKTLARVISRALVPAMTSANKSITEWWKTNRKLIETKLPEWIETVTKALKILSIGVGIFLAMGLIQHMITLISLIRGLTIAILAMNLAVIVLPLLLATAAAAFIALMEDVQVFFAGGESAIGDMIKKFPEWESEIHAVAKALKFLSDIFKNLIGLATLDVEMLTPEFVRGVMKVRGIGADISESTGGLLSDIGSSISNATTTTIDNIEIVIQGGADTAENIANSVQSVFQQSIQDLGSTVEQ